MIKLVQVIQIGAIKVANLLSESVPRPSFIAISIVRTEGMLPCIRPALRAIVRKGKLMNHVCNVCIRMTSGYGGRKLLQRAERIVHSRMKGAGVGLLAAIIVRDPLGQAGAGVAKLEAVAVQLCEINGRRIGYVMKGRIKTVRRRHRNRHVGIDQDLGVCQRAGDPFHAVVGALVLVYLADVGHEHEDQRMAGGGGDDTITQDRIRLVVCIGLIGDDETGFFSAF